MQIIIIIINALLVITTIITANAQVNDPPIFTNIAHPLITSSQVRNIKIDPSKTYQEIEHFAASDAWSGNFVGMHWANEEKEQIARIAIQDSPYTLQMLPVIT